ncbi:ER-golgi trafficking TRAPP I complex 85 kDa subunit-domain-containing protein [Lenzites betulinus]|nr:ER-golgi trafficking TRAPP I complex 85 kDa subunit-domain-containing protein [Lenzites betulinus]
MAPPTLPTSLSPHVCLLASPDVQEVLEGAGLPSLPEILQCFSPLPQITTRTTSLTSVPHASFALRFSDVVEIENAVHEDEEQRAGRMLDWMGERISARCERWVDTLESVASEGGGKMWRDRTPWWEEVKRCVEGDYVPNSSEGWNHPVSLILAVTTTAANPLQALQELTARAFDFPPWVDLTSMRYFLIIHPSSAPLADPIAEALFNAVKKQYGLHSFLLPLHLPTDPLPQPVPVPSLPPRLPALPSLHSPPRTPQPSRPGSNALSPTPTPPPHPASPMPSASRPPPLTNKAPDNPPPSPTVYTGSTLRLTQDDIQQIGRFVREFVTMSLIPWMEKCVMEWNENYSSSRRLPSRLFSSTRRLFGASAASSPATPTHGSSPSVSSVNSRYTHGQNSSVSSIASVASMSTMTGGNVNQQRRLAEFATILGDYKLAIAVWETLRKEGRGGSDILPLLSAPSPALSLHADHALSTLRGPQPRQIAATPYEVPAHAQLRALAYAVRWETGIDRQEFLGSTLEGERWLVKAASSAEEPPTAILYAHAAFLSESKGGRRKAAFWYLAAAEKLEKTGIKPLAMFFFRKAHGLFRDPPSKELSPAFWESEDRSPTGWEGFSAVLPAIEHELGRLLYTTGDTAAAVKYFLELLKPPAQIGPQLQFAHAANGAGSPLLPQPSRDKVYLEDFRVAFKHFKTTEGDAWKKLSLRLPITFCQAKQMRIRFPGDAIEGDSAAWEKLEQDWAQFWSLRGKEKLGKSGKAAVNENFWVDVALRNPLDVEVTLTRLTVSVREVSAKDADAAPDFVEVEVVDDVVLGPKDTRTIPISVKSTRPAALVITNAVYEFFSLLPAVESLAVRGRRLNDTPIQRQGKVYAPDVLMTIEVEEAGQRLHAHFVDDRHLNLAQGEYKRQCVWLMNSGTRPIRDLWVIGGEEDELWFDTGSIDTAANATSSSSTKNEVLHFSNSLAPRKPYRILLDAIHSSPQLAPGEEMQLPLILHAAHHGEKELSLLFVFREADDTEFHSTRVTRRYEVKPILKVTTSARPSASTSETYVVNIEVENITGSSNIELKQLSTMGASWECSPMLPPSTVVLPPRQLANFSLGARPTPLGTGPSETGDFVVRKLKVVLQGDQVDASEPPPLDLTCTHIAPDANIVPLHTPATRHFIHCGRRTMTAQATAAAHPDIPTRLHRAIFSLYNPSTIDVVLFWELPAQRRAGHILLQGPTLGAGHAPLRELVGAARSMKVKRSMYAETQRERAAILEAVQACEWNREDDPVAVFVQDGGVVEHDFRQGPCHVPVAFTFRNLSLTHPARVTLKLAEAPEADPADLSSNLLPPPYAGRLTFRRVLEPSQTYTAQTRLWATRPGCYALDSWTAETEVGEPMSLTPSDAEPGALPVWQSRQLRYVQRPPAGEQPCVTVVDVARLA